MISPERFCAAFKRTEVPGTTGVLVPGVGSGAWLWKTSSAYALALIIGGALIHAVTITSCLPVTTADLSRQAKSDDAPTLSIHHRGLAEPGLHLVRTGNRLSLAALVTLGPFFARSIPKLGTAGSRIWGDIPIFALAAYTAVLFLPAISRSRHS